MADSRVLYLMLSQTGTGIGKVIRCLTRYDYNHVSLSLDPELRQWVSFARYVCDVPLAGGFVREYPERFFSTGNCVPVRIYQIPISEHKYRMLKHLFSQAGTPDCHLIYNSFSPVFTFLGMRFHIQGSFDCLEFANTVLDEANSSIAALDTRHSGELIYDGDLQALLPDSGDRSDAYFDCHGTLGGTIDTVVHFGRLFWRIIRHRPDLLFSTLRSS